MGVWSCLVIILAFESAVIIGQKSVDDDCTLQETCTACIRTLGCIWCNVEDIQNKTDGEPQCMNEHQVAQSNQMWCSKGKRENYTSQLEVIDDREFSSGKKGEKAVQLRPQNVKLKLRKGEDYRFPIWYKRATDYPMDLYFLVDVSRTMEDFREVLSKLGSELAKELRSLTSEFRLGFGSFSDKNTYPSFAKSKHGRNVAKTPYSFKHSLSLTNNTIEFEEKVNSAETIGNHDNPEGGFDGIMQTLVCKDLIGWRSDARHILIHASDAPPHIGGDGKYAGLPRPNDEQCHLNESGYYDYSELQDYPSIGQISWQAEHNNVNIIFAVFNSTFENVFKHIIQRIKGSTTRTVDSTYSNVVQLIKQEYETLVESLTMTRQTTSDVIDVQLLSKCLDENAELQSTGKCNDIHIDDTVEFIVKIKALTCPERKEDWNQTIEIRPQGINETLIVNVELLCGCECLKDKPENTDDSICRGHGKLDCGVCSCDAGYVGKNCQSTKDGDDVDVNNSCRRSADGVICGDHGSCDGRKCICKYGWDGEACEIETDTSSCLPPGKNAEICSNAGKCERGRCVCDKEMKRHGEFCEECPTCPSQKCDEFKDCVECIVHKTGSIHAESPNCDGCDKHNIEKVDAIKINADDENSEEHFCQIPASDGSTFVFTYFYNGQNVHVKAEKDKKYPIIDDFVAATLGVMALTLLLGLLIILAWKVVTHVHDKREFEKFEKERANPKWGLHKNEIYREPVRTYANPMRGQAGPSN